MEVEEVEGASIVETAGTTDGHQNIVDVDHGESMGEGEVIDVVNAAAAAVAVVAGNNDDQDDQGEDDIMQTETVGQIEAAEAVNKHVAEEASGADPGPATSLMASTVEGCRAFVLVLCACYASRFCSVF